MEQKGSLDFEIYTVVNTHIHFCLEEEYRMFSEISVLTYQTEQTHNSEEHNMNNKEILLRANTEDLNFERLRNIRGIFCGANGKT
jgi:hypothetical protein